LKREAFRKRGGCFPGKGNQGKRTETKQDKWGVAARRGQRWGVFLGGKKFGKKKRDTIFPPGSRVWAPKLMGKRETAERGGVFNVMGGGDFGKKRQQTREINRRETKKTS